MLPPIRLTITKGTLLQMASKEEVITSPVFVNAQMARAKPVKEKK